jgi:hypothetical protein
MSAAETFKEARERAESVREGTPSWIPVAAAILAVFAAVSGVLANLRTTAALVAKNDAIVATAHAADSWNEYEARSIKEHIDEVATLTAPPKDVPRLRSLATHERVAAQPAMSRARGYEDEAERYNTRSERLIAAHEVLEVSTTLFEVSIVLVSMTALIRTRLLPIVAGIGALVGVVILLIGVTR